MFVRKVKKSREREFVPEFAVVNAAGEITSLFRRINGARISCAAYNDEFPWAGTYKVIKIEEVEY